MMNDEMSACDDKAVQQSKAKLPRLYHKKSKTGCQRCRARRVKCDETRPVCGSCNRHEVPCVYVNPVPLSKPTTQKDASSGSNSPEQQKPIPLDTLGEPPIPFPFLQYDQVEALQLVTVISESVPDHDDAMTFSIPEGKSRRKLELRLLQNFIEHTSQTFSACHSPAVQHAWSVDVPKLALEHDNLLYEMFAISALHLLKSEPNNAELIVARQAYLGLSLREHRQALALLHSQCADAVCFTSSLVFIDAFASIQDRLLIPYSPPMHWLQMARGAGSVFSIALFNKIGKQTSSVHAIVSAEPDLCDEDALFSSRNRDGPLQELLSHERQSELWDLETSQAYERTLSYIGGIQIIMKSDLHILGVARVLMAFALMVPKKFIDFVEECRPRALAILAYYFSLAANMAEIWWIGGVAHREVEAIARILPLQWQAVMVGPLTTVGLGPVPIE